MRVGKSNKKEIFTEKDERDLEKGMEGWPREGEESL
jgi:hypothetical protein